MAKTEGNFFPTSNPKYKKVMLDLYYMVRADDEQMVERAKDCLLEDIMSLVKYEGLYNSIRLVDAPDATEEDIPEFLLEEQDSLESIPAHEWQDLMESVDHVEPKRID